MNTYPDKLNYGGTGGAIAVDKPASEWEMESKRLDEEIGMTFEKARHLASVLTPVPRMSPSMNVPENCKPEQSLSPIADTVRRQRGSVASIREQLDSILNQLAI